MEPTSERWIRGKVALNISIVDDTLSRRNRVDPLAAYAIAGVAAQSIALYLLWLDDREEACAWFRRTVSCHEEFFKARGKRPGAGTWANEANMRHTMLSAALLSRDGKAIDATARACLSMDKDFPVRFHQAANLYWYVQAVSDIVLGDDEGARAVARSVNSGIFGSLDDCQHYDGRERRFNGLRLCLTGIVRGNEIMVRNGLRQVLRYHDAEHHVDALGPPDGMTSISAAVQVRLARARGLAIGPGDIEEKYRKYVPRSLFE